MGTFERRAATDHPIEDGARTVVEETGGTRFETALVPADALLRPEARLDQALATDRAGSPMPADRDPIPCPACRLQGWLCVCAHAPRVATRTSLVLVVHVRDLGRT